MYHIVVFRGRNRAVRRIKDPQIALALFKAAALKFGVKYTFFVFARNVKGPTKEQRDERKRGQCYCPYCRAYRKFPTDETYGVRRCFVCGISENDFYSRKWNREFNKLDEGTPVKLRRIRKPKVEEKVQFTNRVKKTDEEKRAAKRERARLRKERKG